MPLRFREEVQVVLRRGDGELNLFWLASCLESLERVVAETLKKRRQLRREPAY